MSSNPFFKGSRNREGVMSSNPFFKGSRNREGVMRSNPSFLKEIQTPAGGSRRRTVKGGPSFEKCHVLKPCFFRTDSRQTRPFPFTASEGRERGVSSPMSQSSGFSG